MSFQMTHLEIAYRLAQKLSINEGLAEFILGSVVPDSVHFRDDFCFEHKVHSHCFEECGSWGDTRDYERWLRNIKEFWDKFGEGETDVKRKMYILGICVHCYTDYWNDLLIWRALQKEYLPTMTLDQFRGEYYPEAKLVDKWLYQNSSFTKEIFRLMNEADDLEIPGYINKEDILKMKDHLTNVQYDIPEKLSTSGFKYYPSEKILWFVDTVTERVAGMIGEYV